MIPATQEQIEDACMIRSGPDAKRYLTAQGLFASEKDCRRAIVRLMQDGVRKQLPGGGPGAKGTEIERFDAMMGCQRMLKRHLETGRHWINDAGKMAEALQMAGMITTPVL